jgi:pimeloyl-ACP methyl ester carboxylesterase/DNA-binding SARP family transcriptional activator
MTPPVALDVLGTLRVSTAEVGVAEVGGPMQRKLLGLLAVRRGLETRAEWLVDALWDGQPSRSAATTLQSHVAHLRRVLEPNRQPGSEPAVLVTVPGGYLLVAQQVEVDADRVVELVRRAHDLAAVEALPLVERALSLFRGAPYEELAGVEAVAAEAARLNEVRMAAIGLHLDALRELGRVEELCSAAAEAHTLDPQREGPALAFAAALALAGRSPEALRVLHRFRRELAIQTGLDPSSAIDRLEAQILAGDAAASQPSTLRRSGGANTPASVIATPPLRYATAADGVAIAYQSIGDGPAFVAVPPLAQNIEICWQDQQHRRLIERAAERCRFVHFDKRGSGMSDRAADFTMERRIGDFLAVLDAAGVERGVVCGVSEAGPLAVAFAVAYPERVAGLYLVNTLARSLVADDYPIGVTAAEYAATTQAWEAAWGADDGRILDWFAPSRRNDVTYAAWFGHYMRQSCSPGTLAEINRANGSIDVRHLLPLVTVPTVVVHRERDRVTPIAWGRFLADQIPGAQFRQVSGRDHLPWVGDNWSDIVDGGVDLTLSLADR